MRGGARGAIHHHAITLAATSSQPSTETLAARKVLAHRRTAFVPRTCGLRGGAAAVAVVLIGYGGERLLLGQGGGDLFVGRDRLLPLHRRATTLDRFCSNASSAALRV